VAETVRGFKEILDGKHDAVAEGDFYMKGGIDEIEGAPTSTEGKKDHANDTKPEEAKSK
jgi:F0F1-type ATP synthase beta subunit